MFFKLNCLCMELWGHHFVHDCLVGPEGSGVYDAGLNRTILKTVARA